MYRRNKDLTNFLGFLLSSLLFIIAAILYLDITIKIVFFTVGVMNIGLSMSYLRKFVSKIREE